MDPGTNDLEQVRRTGSFSLKNRAGSSLRHSLNISRSVSLEIDDEVNSENVSEAGDIGDRSLRRRHSMGRSSRLSADSSMEQGAVFPGTDQDVLESYGSWARDPRPLTTTSVVTSLPEETISPLATKSLLPYEVEKLQKEEEPVLPKSLEYISYLIHLSVFGILGVLTRYLLQRLFGPTVARVTSDGSILYLDLPSNMVGSFLMGWVGVVFKADIARVSDLLATGLSTGYLGSLTTFSGWNQKMLDLAVNGRWVYAVLGILLGLFLAAYSIILGIETAKGFRWILLRIQDKGKTCSFPRVESFRSHMVSLVVMFLVLVGLLSVSAVLLKKEFSKGTSQAQLWLGCIVASPGVWLRWFLARLNGRGVGKGRRLLKWVPLGTLIANVSAACIMAALSTLNKAVNSTTCKTVGTGIQFGLLGCLSTVSTLMAEFNAMRESKYPWRAYAYAFFTIGVSFILGTLIYSIPVWVIRFS